MRYSMKRRLLATLVLVALLFVPGAPSVADDAGFSEVERAEIERVIQEYIRENPEIILEAIQIIQGRQRQAAAERQQRVMEERSDEIYSDPGSPVGGNPIGDVTVVEFFDYQCPHCRAMTPRMDRLLEEDKNIRVVYKEWPVLGPVSALAARVALAARKQGAAKYLDLHGALMSIQDRLNIDLVYGAAEDVGLDIEQLKRDMKDPDISAVLARNSDLAAALGLTGTPGFVIGDQLVPGEIDFDTLKGLIDDARRGG